MPSSRFVSLKLRIGIYAGAFITDKDDFDATNEDHLRALAFRILASAAVEEFVEERCKETARAGIDRLKRGEATTTGRALVTWGVARKAPGFIPVHPDEIHDHFGDFGAILQQYIDSVGATHGIGQRDFRNLVNPVGVRAHQLPSDLPDRLQALADRRDPAVHTAAAGTKVRLGPSLEHKQITDLVDLLEVLDAALDEVLDSYPVVVSSGT